MYVPDDVSTKQVIQLAADKMGKSVSKQQMSKICAYLVNDQWYSNAGDLRAALSSDRVWNEYVQMIWVCI